jgi:alpha-D-ribose 1-methylphosphonate 5-phosphate C-P lyase
VDAAYFSDATTGLTIDLGAQTTGYGTIRITGGASDSTDDADHIDGGADDDTPPVAPTTTPSSAATAPTTAMAAPGSMCQRRARPPPTSPDAPQEAPSWRR